MSHLTEVILFSESCDSSVLSRVSESIKVESEYREGSTSPPSSFSQQSLHVSPDLQLHPVGGRRPGTAEPLPCPLAGLQVAQRLTAGALARSTAGLLKSCPEASFNIQQTFDRLTCDGHAECQTTAKMSSHGGENFTLCLGRRWLRSRRRRTPSVFF